MCLILEDDIVVIYFHVTKNTFTGIGFLMTLE
jgi:hypothetical protein